MFVNSDHRQINCSDHMVANYNLKIIYELKFVYRKKMREWMYLRIIDGFLNDQFIAGVAQFIEFCKSMPRYNPQELRCPCRKCKNRKLISVDDVHYHLVKGGFVPHYYQWVSHGETDEMFAALLAESRQNEGCSSTDPTTPTVSRYDN